MILLLVVMEDLLVFSLKAKKDEVKSLYMHIFEQSIALYMYSHNKLSGDSYSSHTFQQQMRFAGAVKQELFSSYPSSDEQMTRRKMRYIFKLLDSGVKALDILSSVANEGQFTKFEVSSVERIMERNSIMFPSLNMKHPFSMEAMHSMVSNPLPTLQRFFLLPHPEEFIDTVVKCRLAELINRDELLGLKQKESDLSSWLPMYPQPSTRLSLSELVKAYNDKELTLERLLQAYSDGKIKLKVEDFSSQIEKSIEDVLQDWSTFVLESLYLSYRSTPPMIDSIIDNDLLKREGILKVNNDDLKKLCLLGQSDQIGEMLSRKIKENFMKENATKELLLSKETVQSKSFAKWYRHCKIGFISEVSQIPSMVAALLYNRLANSDFLGYVTLSNRRIVTHSGKVDALQELVTSVINRTLFRNNYPDMPYKVPSPNFGFNDGIDTLKDYVERDLESIDLLPSHIMKEWAEYDKKKTRDRFKRPLKNFYGCIDEITYRIENQQQNSIHYYFPVTKNYPLPFWAITN